ncbi:MAG: hypothetical protein ABSF26_31750, partial [Thermoguttaceae bacterium]
MNRHLPLLVLLVGLWIVSPVSAGTIADVSALPLGTDATIDQAVILSTTDLTADPLYKSFQLRDTTRAITIYGTNAEIDAALSGFGVGSVIEISGQTANRGGALVLITGTFGGFAVTGRTTTLPLLTNSLLVAPSDIAAPYESNLVCLNNVSFADTGFFAAGSDYALTGGSATVRIVSDDLGLTGYPIPSGPLDITGIVIPADPISPGNYFLAPRGPADMVSVPEPSSLTLLVLGGVGILFMLQS